MVPGHPQSRCYGYDPRLGDLRIQHFFPEYPPRPLLARPALTIEGKIGNWDLTYAGAYLDRKDYASSDYTDYAEAYDNLYSSVGGIAGYFYFQNAAGSTIDPRQHVIGTDHFKKMSQEFRVASPSTNRFRIVAGLFYQRQSERHPPGLPSRRPGAAAVGQRHARHIVADPAAPRRQGLCDVRRGELRRHPDLDPDRRRARLHLRQQR